MSLERPVIAVIGAGAVGGYYGARLTQHGHDVHLFTRSDCRAIRQSGMQVQSRDGDFHLSPEQIHVYDDVGEMPKADLVIVTLKTTANFQLPELVGPLLKSDSIILTLQNGLGNEQRLAELFGESRVLGGMAFVCINRTGPGQIMHSDHGMVRLGEIKGGPSVRASRIAELFNASRIPCRAIENLIAGRWDKLVWNVPFNGLGAVLGLSTDRLIGSEAGLEMVRRLMREVIDAAAPLGIVLESAIISDKIQHTLTMGAYKTSMQIDRELNRPLEVESIIGEPLRSAVANGVLTPAMEMVYNMLRLLNRPHCRPESP